MNTETIIKTKAAIIAAIDEAVGAWVVHSVNAARRQQEPPIIGNVGIPAIDKALPFLEGDARNARNDFLSVLKYFLRESPEALEIRKRRKVLVEKAASRIRAAAALLENADNAPLATLLCSIAEQADNAQYGCIYPRNIYTESKAVDGTSEIRHGVFLRAHFVPDALTGNFNGKRGSISRDANIVRALIQFFPNEQGFFTNGGYALISKLAALCGASKATPVYVRSIIEQDRRTAEPASKAIRDNSIIGLLSKPKI
ncbi:hypothetical protein [Acidithiobacillus thiooxidans]|uniref:hypothetical protein n=1 Tax=Acidithiobacillus thiooxidans TaxID=930 RepID=UPI0004E2513B|nr:hypothetical protein [Acidithiobacillus thiooxidans]